jgi:outer membrane biosynthesis protein TonB
MHIYISQRALEEGVNAIIEEMVPFSYMMLREGYDAESIIQFLESAEDEDFDYIYEQADSEMLSESVVDEMSDEEVLLHEEQIGLIINHFGLMEAAGAIRGAISLAAKLRAMTPAALKKFIKNNPAARSLARKLGLDKKSPVPKTGTPKPTATPKTQAPKPKSSRTTDQKTQTASQPPKLQPPKSKTPTKTNPSGLGGILKSTPGKLAGTALVVGAGAGLLGGGGDDSTTADAEEERQKALDAALADANNPDKDKPTSTPRPPRKDPTTGTPWWIARNQSLIGKRKEFRSDVALKRFRNPSAKANFTNIRSHYEYLVDYLIAEGHAETVEEATYVMQQMGEEAAVEILSEVI